MAFQHNHEVVQSAISRKGGKIRGKRKGFGSNPELARAAGSKGGYAKAANKSNGNSNTVKKNTGSDRNFLEAVIGTLDE